MVHVFSRRVASGRQGSLLAPGFLRLLFAKTLRFSHLFFVCLLVELLLRWAGVLHLFGQFFLEFYVILFCHGPFLALSLNLLLHTSVYDLAFFTLDLIHTLLVDLAK